MHDPLTVASLIDPNPDVIHSSIAAVSSQLSVRKKPNHAAVEHLIGGHR